MKSWLKEKKKKGQLPQETFEIIKAAIFFVLYSVVTPNR